jgi:crossover junction endodeoxyribonuclease RusA
MVEMSRAVGPWREAVRAETQRAAQFVAEKPVEVTIDFWLTRPKGHYGTGRNATTLRGSAPVWPSGRPDLDKLARAVLDGLTMGGAWRDDSQVVRLNAAKWYLDYPDEAPGCTIIITEAKD